MKGARRLLRDPRIAAGVVVVAVLLVGYRVMGLSGAASSTPLVAAAAAAPAGERGAGGEASGSGALPAGALAPLSRRAARAGGGATRAAGEIAWSWDRNPFLPTWRDETVKSGPGAPLRSDPGAAGTAGALGVLSSLRGTVVSGGERYAIVGDKVVPLGETVSGWTVERIEPYRVVVRRGAEVRTLELVGPVPGGTRGGGER